MPLVGTAFGHDVDHSTAVASVLGFEVREHAQLGDGIDRQNSRRIAEHSGLVNCRIVAEAVVHVGAVEQIVVRTAARTVHRESSERARRIADLVGRARDSGV